MWSSSALGVLIWPLAGVWSWPTVSKYAFHDGAKYAARRTVIAHKRSFSPRSLSFLQDDTAHCHGIGVRGENPPSFLLDDTAHVAH